MAPRDFDTPPGANFWFLMPLDPRGVNHSFEGFMRLKPGATIERARSEMAAVMASVGRDFPESGGTVRVYVDRPLIESIVGELGPILVVVLSATGVLLLLACVNVTNLMLARGAARGREMAVRVALGAGRGRIVRQLLTESLLLAAVGAVVGVLGAYAFVRLLLTLGASQLPRLDAVAFDVRVLLFVLAVLLVCGVLVGFAPALRLAATDVNELMNEGGRSGSGGRGTARWLNAMTIAEVALAVSMVAGAGWLVRSFDNLRTRGSGIQGRQPAALRRHGDGRAVPRQRGGLPGVHRSARAVARAPRRRRRRLDVQRPAPAWPRERVAGALRRRSGCGAHLQHPPAHRQPGLLRSDGRDA